MNMNPFLSCAHFMLSFSIKTISISTQQVASRKGIAEKYVVEIVLFTILFTLPFVSTAHNKPS